MTVTGSAHSYMCCALTSALVSAALIVAAAPAGCQPQSGAGTPGLNAGAAGNPYAAWAKGLPADPAFFPIAVWLQAPANAQRFKQAGINVYIGLWKGPTEDQLADLRRAQMPVICAQNDVGLANKDDEIILGWMHGDEPDNAQAIPGQEGYGPPIEPEKVIADYEAIRAADPSRPVLLNLGQGVAHDNYIGRGVRRGHLEDYPEYVKAADIVSFDIYPVVHRKPEIAGKLWYVPKGVDRLRQWTGDRKVVWNCIECTRISNENIKPTPDQVRSEVWMSLIHGSMGLIYFVHQFKPSFIEAGLLADEEMLEGVTAVNTQIQELAPVLNSPNVPSLVSAQSSSPDVPIDTMVKRHHGDTYVFAVSMRDADSRAEFSVKDLDGTATVEVLGESRTIPIEAGRFSDSFKGYEVHLYRIAGAGE